MGHVYVLQRWQELQLLTVRVTVVFLLAAAGQWASNLVLTQTPPG